MQQMSRRRFLQYGGFAALAASGMLTAETQAASETSGLGPLGALSMPWRTRTAGTPSLAIHTLSRFAYGHSLSDLTAIRSGAFNVNQWFEAQLHPTDTDSALLTQKLANFKTLQPNPVGQPKSITELIHEFPQGEPGYTGDTVNNVLIPEFQIATILRKVYSQWQLKEVLVDFWTDHLNIYLFDDLQRWGKLVDDRDVIRRHALGNFHAMLLASAKSPAMVTYLDNNTNRALAPNENYAREIMELHTLSVNGPYNQNDVQQLAKCFTGWTVYPLRDRTGPHPQAGQFYFNAGVHDRNTKTVLGRTITGRTGAAGIQEAEEVIRYLAEHPSTAFFIATKLVRKFVADDPPLSLVDRVAETFSDAKNASDQIAQCLRMIFNSDEFRTSYGQKTKRPLDFLITSMRMLGTDIAVNVDTRNNNRITAPVAQQLMRLYLPAMGQQYYGKTFPDGYPDVGAEWVNTNALLSRWNFGLNLAKNALGQANAVSLGAWVDSLAPQTVGALVDAMIERILGYTIDAADRDMLIAYAASGGAASTRINATIRNQKTPELAAILIASPYFQAR